MTASYTQAEWCAVIDEAEKDISGSFPEYKAPIPGSPGFAMCIDHTLLKLDATKDQIDELCEEARRLDFLVRLLFPQKDALLYLFLLRVAKTSPNHGPRVLLRISPIESKI